MAAGETDDLASQFVDQLYLAGADLPPSRQKTADEVLAEMKKIPLFMTSLDPEETGESNEQLEAIKALAYEGTRAEISDNFRNQGNDCVRQKQYRDARDFYTQALQALKAPRQAPEDPESEPRVLEIDDEEVEAKRERSIEEACYANRALCNLEMSITAPPKNRCRIFETVSDFAPLSVCTENYGSCQRDCAAALRLSPHNVKAYFRAANACLALDKTDEAIDACRTALLYDPNNAALKSLLDRTQQRKHRLTLQAQERNARIVADRERDTNLQAALRKRNILTRETSATPDMGDAVISLTDPKNINSTLTFPVILLYPLAAQSDFIKAIAEDESLADHLEYTLPVPWDESSEYCKDGVECYMETAAGGLIKAGKNLSLGKLLGSGKVEVVDGLVRISVVPRAKASTWIQEWKKRNGK
ncbi:tpr repeat protein [Teratosphaeria destructans]|uniref:Tpr repeat protein n=1 Tax=Teratosphaeria destructans TaxID=418781 RepID=A0A9W7SYB5_9PEZI|nr:tpr repeat protein [Teratosphaeria destructans]